MLEEARYLPNWCLKLEEWSLDFDQWIVSFFDNLQLRCKTGDDDDDDDDYDDGHQNV